MSERTDRVKALARRNGMWWWNRRLRIADWCFALFTLPFSGVAMLVGITGELGLLSTPLTDFLSSFAGERWWLLGLGALCFVVPGVLASLTMLWRRSAPRWLLPAGLLMLALYGNPIPLMVGLYSYPAHFDDRRVLALWFTLGCVAHGVVFHTTVAQYVMTGVFVFAMPTVAGLWIGTRRELVERLRERAERLEREQHMMAEQAITAERTRIAREMHDVVAHRVSLMVLHAGGLEVSSVDERTERAAGLIRTTGREALTELRGILGVLREEEGQAAPTAPQPVLADVAGLVAQWRGAGMDVECEHAGGRGESPLAVQRTAFRVVQEALTNAAKHATGARVRVWLHHGVDRLEVEVANGPVPGVVDPAPRSGFGLTGLRERVALAGGEISAGPCPDGGWRLRALLSTEEGTEVEAEPAPA
ncbi:sensor histidine kinase [Nocardiopsis sp. NPDC055551]